MATREATIAAALADTLKLHEIRSDSQYAEDIKNVMLDFADSIFEHLMNTECVGYVTSDATIVGLNTKRKDIKPICILPE